MSRSRVWIVLAAAFVLPFAALLGQDRFTEMIGVTEVQGPVRVLVKGQPLAGLTRDDFEIYDRGVLQDIVGFVSRDRS